MWHHGVDLLTSPASESMPCGKRQDGVPCLQWGSICFKGHFPWKQAGPCLLVKYCSFSVLEGGQLLSVVTLRYYPRYCQVPPATPVCPQILLATPTHPVCHSSSCLRGGA